MTNYEIIETIVATIIMAIIIYFVIKWVSKNPKLLEEFNPKKNKVEEAKICRGGWREAHIRGCSCGYSKTGIPVEPINTYSNLAYFAAGWIGMRWIDDKTSIVFCVTMAFLCFGSALYHAIKTRWSAKWDHGGMYAVFGGLAFFIMVTPHQHESWFMLAGAVIFGIVLAFILDGHLMARIGLLLALILAGVVIRGDINHGLTSLGIFMAAMAIWLIDKEYEILGRYGHGAWHILTALALLWLFAGI